MGLASRLAQARRTAGLSQAEVARAVGLDRTAISKIESGHRQVEALELARLASVLLRPVDWFVRDDALRLDIAKLRRVRGQILRIAGDRGATNIRVFGSVARGDTRPDSDVDFLVDMEPGRSLLDRAGLMAELQELLGRHVDVATVATLLDRVRERALREAVPL